MMGIIKYWKSKDQRQLPIAVRYKDTVIREPLYLDILVEDKVIVEVKATEHDNFLYQAQLLGTLRLCAFALNRLGMPYNRPRCGAPVAQIWLQLNIF